MGQKIRAISPETEAPMWRPWSEAPLRVLVALGSPPQLGDWVVKATIIYDPIEVLLIYYENPTMKPLKFFLIPHPEAES